MDTGEKTGAARVKPVLSLFPGIGLLDGVTQALIEFRAVTLRGVAFPGYFVSAHGQIFSQRSGRVLLPYSVGDDYCGVALRRDGKTHRAMVHWLVAEAWIGPRPEGADVCHIDGTRTHNAASNLRYDSRINNLADRAAHGTQQTGQRNPAAKLTDEQAEQVRAQRRAGVSLALIAAAFGVRQSTVSRIANGKRRAV